MSCCYLCQSEAVSRCYTCGQLICAEHGGENCQHCETGVIAEGPRTRQFSARPLRRKEAKHGWWRPQPAEEFEPPACYACKGLARAVCRNCASHYCRDHAGRGALCRECARSARLGVIAFVIALGMMIAIMLLGGLMY